MHLECEKEFDFPIQTREMWFSQQGSLISKLSPIVEWEALIFPTETIWLFREQEHHSCTVQRHKSPWPCPNGYSMHLKCIKA